MTFESSDPSKRLMSKNVLIKDLQCEGVIRGYEPATGKWWVVTEKVDDFFSYVGKAIAKSTVENSWYAEDELQILD